MAILPPGQVLTPREPLPKKPENKPQRAEGTSSRFPWRMILGAFVNKSMSHLKPSESTVWLALFAWVDPETAKVTMPVKRIAGLTGLSERTVERSLRRLRQLGLVETVHRGNVFHHLPGVYQLRGLIRKSEGGVIDGGNI